MSRPSRSLLSLFLLLSRSRASLTLSRSPSSSRFFHPRFYHAMLFRSPLFLILNCSFIIPFPLVFLLRSRRRIRVAISKHGAPGPSSSRRKSRKRGARQDSSLPRTVCSIRCVTGSERSPGKEKARTRARTRTHSRTPRAALSPVLSRRQEPGKRRGDQDTRAPLPERKPPPDAASGSALRPRRRRASSVSGERTSAASVVTANDLPIVRSFDHQRQRKVRLYERRNGLTKKQTRAPPSQKRTTLAVSLAEPKNHHRHRSLLHPTGTSTNDSTELKNHHRLPLASDHTDRLLLRRIHLRFSSSDPRVSGLSFEKLALSHPPRIPFPARRREDAARQPRAKIRMKPRKLNNATRFRFDPRSPSRAQQTESSGGAEGTSLLGFLLASGLLLSVSSLPFSPRTVPPIADGSG